MKTNRIYIAALALSVMACSAFGQTALTSTTTAAAITDTSTTTFTVASATGFTVNNLVLIENEARRITAVNGTTISATRGASGTRAAKHVSGAKVYTAPGNAFSTFDRSGACAPTDELYSPVINVQNGRRFTCTAGQWGEDKMFFVAPTDCTFAPTTLTTTNTYIQVGASNVFVLNGTSNAAAGTNTLTCAFAIPTRVNVNRGSVITDITVAIGSQTTAPTSLGTATLGTITLPTPVATTQTASTVTPVTIGGTVTTVGPTTTVLTVTTAGSFLTFKHTFSTPVEMGTDYQILRYTFPFLQSAAAAMTLNTPGLLVHYREPI